MEKFIVFIVLYFIVVNFVLPRFGIKPPFIYGDLFENGVLDLFGDHP